MKSKIDNESKYVRKLELIQGILKNFIKAKIFNEQDRKDVLQNTLLILVEKQNSYDSNKSFYSWALTICRFQILKFLTESKRNKEDSCDFVEELKDSSSGLDPFDSLVEDERKKDLLNKIDYLKKNLSPQQKTVFNSIIGGKSRKSTREYMKLKETHFNLAYRRTIMGCQKILNNA